MLPLEPYDLNGFAGGPTPDTINIQNTQEKRSQIEDVSL